MDIQARTVQELRRTIRQLSDRLDLVEGRAGNPDFHGAWLQNARISQLWQPYQQPLEGIRYNEAVEHWEQSPDGVNWYPIVGTHEIDRLTSVNAVPGSQWVLEHDGTDMFVEGDDGDLYLSQPGSPAGQPAFYFGQDPNYYSAIWHNRGPGWYGFSVLGPNVTGFFGEVVGGGFSADVGDIAQGWTNICDQPGEAIRGGRILVYDNASTPLFLLWSTGAAPNTIDAYLSGVLGIGDSVFFPVPAGGLRLWEDGSDAYINSRVGNTYLETVGGIHYFGDGTDQYCDIWTHGDPSPPMGFDYTGFLVTRANPLANTLTSNVGILMVPANAFGPGFPPVDWYGHYDTREVAGGVTYQGTYSEDMATIAGLIIGHPNDVIFMVGDGLGAGPGNARFLLDNTGEALFYGTRLRADNRINGYDRTSATDFCDFQLARHIMYAVLDGVVPPNYDALSFIGDVQPAGAAGGVAYYGGQFTTRFDGPNAILALNAARFNPYVLGTAAGNITNMVGASSYPYTAAAYAGAITNAIGFACSQQLQSPTINIGRATGFSYTLLPAPCNPGTLNWAGYNIDPTAAGVPGRYLASHFWAYDDGCAFRDEVNPPTHFIYSDALGDIRHLVPVSHKFAIGAPPGTPYVFVGDTALVPTGILLGVGVPNVAAGVPGSWGFTAVNAGASPAPYAPVAPGPPTLQMSAVLPGPPASPPGPLVNITGWLPTYDSVLGAGWIPFCQ